MYEFCTTKGNVEMRINVLDYYSKEEWELLRKEADKHETPCLVVNLNIIKR